MFRRFQFSQSLFVVIAWVVAAQVASASPAAASAQLSTYHRDGGQTFFALSLTPPAELASDMPHDVIILYDTSASQTGEFREVGLAAVESCIAKLGPQDRVQIFAVDLEARPTSEQFLPAASSELRAAVEKLRGETPLGATDIELALRAAIARFDAARPAGRVVLYVGDGQSTANLLGTESFRQLAADLCAARIPVSSYAVGPQCDGRLLAAIANHTGGNLYVAEQFAHADKSQGVTADRAHQENLRRGANVGALLADWTRAAVIWPGDVTWPAQLGDVYPKSLPPLRTDRDTVVVGAAAGALDAPINIQVHAAGPVGPLDLSWVAQPQAEATGQAFLAQIVDLARSDDGATLPTVGSAGLAETGRQLENGVDGLTQLAERAVATGDLQAAGVAADAVLRRDPGNVQAQTVQRAIQRRQADATRVAEAPQRGGDLNLVRTAQAPLPLPPAPVSDRQPAPGTLNDPFAQPGALIDRVEEERRVAAQIMRREVENTVIDARRQMNDDPDAAIQSIKLALQSVNQATELGPDMRAQLVDKLQVALREAQRAATLKGELDAAREENLAAARERRMLYDRLAQNREKEKQLIDRFNSLLDEGRYDEALEVAAIVEEVDPNGVTPRVATVWSRFDRNLYVMEVARAARWQNFFDTLYQAELSSIPFPDDPPIVYPDGDWWKEMSVRRKERYGSMDLKATGEAEQKIERALRSPLKEGGIDFTDQPLSEAVGLLQEEYGIPIKLDTAALDDLSIAPDQPINVHLKGITLRSALRLMLKDLALTYIVRDEVLMITTPDEAEKQLVVKVYPVADLVLPIDSSALGGGMGGGGIGGGIGGGGGGGIGGGGGGGFGGGGGGFGGGGGGFGGGGQGGGGGGFFSVPDEPRPAPKKQTPTSKSPAAATPAKPAVGAKPKATAPEAKAIAIDKSATPDKFWTDYFSRNDADPAAVRATVRQLMGEKQYDQVVALVYAALRNGQPQPWMYESLGIAMELGGRSKAEIERAVMSAADFSTVPDELMYIAQYLSRLSLHRRAMQLYEQVAKLEPFRGEAFAFGLRAAQKCDDLAGIQWATVGILSQAWPTDQAEIQLNASRVAKATLTRLESEGKTAERDAYLKKLQDSVIWDCVVQVSWTGNADVDLSVEEPSGTICSAAEPRTTGGGVALGDSYSPSADGAGQVFTETYACPRGFAGTYRARIHRVLGEVTAGKVTVDVYMHLRSGDVQHERKQLALDDKDAMVVFNLDKGQRTEPLEATQIASAVTRQQSMSRAVLAQQLSGGADERVLPNRPLNDWVRRAMFGRGAVGYQPIIQTLPEGTMFGAIGVVSADRRYVRITAAPLFSTIGDVQTVTFAGRAEQVDDQTQTPDANTPMIPLFNRGGGGFGGR